MLTDMFYHSSKPFIAGKHIIKEAILAAIVTREDAKPQGCFTVCASLVGLVLAVECIAVAFFLNPVLMDGTWCRMVVQGRYVKTS